MSKQAEQAAAEVAEDRHIIGATRRQEARSEINKAVKSARIFLSDKQIKNQVARAIELDEEAKKGN